MASPVLHLNLYILFDCPFNAVLSSLLNILLVSTDLLIAGVCYFWPSMCSDTEATTEPTTEVPDYPEYYDYEEYDYDSYEEDSVKRNIVFPKF